MSSQRRKMTLADLEPHAARGKQVCCGQCPHFTSNFCTVGARHVMASTPMCNYGRAIRLNGRKKNWRDKQ